MIPTHGTEPKLAQLSIRACNWQQHDRELRDLCIYNFGDSGQELRSLEPVPLKPFHRQPSKLDLERHTVTGEYMHGRYVYPRVELPTDQVENFHQLSPEEQVTVMDNMPLTHHAQSKLDRDNAIFAASVDTKAKSDTALLTLLISIVSSESKSAILVHRDYNAYVDAPPHRKSLRYYLLMRALHRVGDASTKHLRTAQLIRGAQGEQSLAEWWTWLTINMDQFVIDFEAHDHPGYVSCNELKSFFFLHGTDRSTYRIVYDEHLRLNPSGRFPDPNALMLAFQNYDNSQKMSISDPVSSQGNAFIANNKPPANAATAAPPPTKKGWDNKSKRSDPRAKTYPNPCPLCLAKGYEFYGHDETDCRNTIKPRKPSRKALIAPAAQSATAQPPAQPAAQSATGQSGRNTAARVDRLEALMSSLSSLTQPTEDESDDDIPIPAPPVVTDRLDRLEHSLESILLLLKR